MCYGPDDIHKASFGILTSMSLKEKEAHLLRSEAEEILEEIFRREKALIATAANAESTFRSLVQREYDRAIAVLKADEKYLKQTGELELKRNRVLMRAPEYLKKNLVK